MWKWRWKFGSKNVEFLTNRMFASLMIRVFPSLEHSRSVSDKPQTMSGLSGVPKGTSSQTI